MSHPAHKFRNGRIAKRLIRPLPPEVVRDKE